MARKFLYFIVVCVLLVFAVLLALRLFAGHSHAAGVHAQGPFRRPATAGRQRLRRSEDVVRAARHARRRARWQPANAPPAPVDVPKFAVFFVHPTSYLGRDRWNASLDDAGARARARLFVKGLASPFGQASEIWAPRYRQAAVGAFLSNSLDAEKALDLAYSDVSQAFDEFLAHVAPGTPIVLAGHSQGALLIDELLRRRIAGTPLQKRIAMAYPIGWPISVQHDLAALGLPACARADQAGCIVTWSSFAEPADPGMLLERYQHSAGSTARRAATRACCASIR